MDNHGNWYWITFIALLVSGILGFNSCASTPPPTRIVVEEPTRFVRLEVTNRASQHHHSHPITIRKEEVRNILKAFSVKPRSNFTQGNKFGYMNVPQLLDPSPAFSSLQLKFLAEHLSDGLQQATPLEEVVFYLEEPQSQDTFLLTSGGAFFQDGHLHVLLANFRLPTIGQEEVLKARANPLLVLSAPGYDVIPGAKGTTQTSPAWKAFLMEMPQEVIVRVDKTRGGAKLRKSPLHQREELDRSGEPSLSEKLRELETMKKEGLITEEEFQTIRTKLLNSY
jgi:hypothetical protein